MKGTRVVIFKFVVFIVSLGGGFIFGNPQADAQEKIRIGISSTSPGFLPTIVAEKKGFYTKYGLSSEHIRISLAVAMNAATTGDLDYAITMAQGVSAAVKGLPVMFDSYFPAYSREGSITNEALQAAIDDAMMRAKIGKAVTLTQVADRTLIVEAQKEPGLR